MMKKPKRRPRKNLLSRTEAWTILEPFARQLYDWLDESWDWVQAILDQDPERRATLDASTVAGIVYDRFKYVMTSGLNGERRIELVTEGRMTRVYVGEQIILRFKKLDRRLCSRNINTLNQESIYYQQYYLDGVPGRPTNITFGYVPELSGSSLKGVYFTCPKDWKSNHWNIKLGGASEDGALLFDPHRFDDGSQEMRVVSAKKTKKQA